MNHKEGNQMKIQAATVVVLSVQNYGEDINMYLHFILCAEVTDELSGFTGTQYVSQPPLSRGC